MIRSTHANNPHGTVVAYSDNAAVMQGAAIERFYPHSDGVYRYRTETTHIVMKVETHNHPTAIAPHPGAATGSGGEIRDQGATGTGAKPKAGLTGFSVSNLNIPASSSHGKHTSTRRSQRQLRPSAPNRLGARDHARGPDRRPQPLTTNSGGRISPVISAPLKRASAVKCAATISRSWSRAASAISPRYILRSDN